MTEDLTLSQIVYPELKTSHRLNYSGGANFRIWRCQLDFVFKDNNVDYVLTQPIPDKEANPAAHQKFLDDDFTARHIILGSLHDHLYMSYHRHQTAKSMMDELTSFFTKPSITKRMILLKRYVSHKMAEDTPINEHLMKMSALAMELELEGVKVPEELQAVFLMNSLPDSWEDVSTTLRLNIDRDEKGLSLDNVRNRVRDTGTLKEIFRARDEAKSVSGSSSKSFKGKCYGCGEFGHRINDCPYEVI